MARHEADTLSEALLTRYCGANGRGDPRPDPNDILPNSFVQVHSFSSYFVAVGDFVSIFFGVY